MTIRRGSNFAFALAVASIVAAFACLGPDRAGASVLVRQDATLTTANRAPGMPTSSTPGRQLRQAQIGIRTYGQDTSEPSYFVDAKIELAGQPVGDPDAELNLGFGHRDGTVCVLAALLNRDTSDYSGSSYEFTGYNPDYFPTPSKPWNCVAVFVDNSFDGEPATATYDAFVGQLKDTRRSPKLTISRIELLGQRQKTLRLVRGVSTTIGVAYRNSGQVQTGTIRVTGKGRGVKIKATRNRKLASKSGSSSSLGVKLTGRQKRTKVRIVVSDGSVKAVRTLTVIRVRPPRRPLPGRYRSPSGDVRFTVRRSRIVGWSGTMATRCGIAPDPYTYTTNTYDFPTVKIPRNGIVQAHSRGSNYGVSLRLRIVGGKVTRGLFNYAGPAACSAASSFEARRVGR